MRMNVINLSFYPYWLLLLFAFGIHPPFGHLRGERMIILTSHKWIYINTSLISCFRTFRILLLGCWRYQPWCMASGYVSRWKPSLFFQLFKIYWSKRSHCTGYAYFWIIFSTQKMLRTRGMPLSTGSMLFTSSWNITPLA